MSSAEHLSRDPVLRTLLENAGPLSALEPAPDPLAAPLRSVTGQQLSVRAAAAIAERLKDATGFEPARIVAASPEALRALGLSWAKVRTVQALAAAQQSGQIDFAHLQDLSDDDVTAALLPLPGIGRWTAEMFLLFGLGRPDVFSFGDLALRKALSLHYPGEDHSALTQRWQPYRSDAARLLWRTFHVTPVQPQVSENSTAIS